MKDCKCPHDPCPHVRTDITCPHCLRHKLVHVTTNDHLFCPDLYTCEYETTLTKFNQEKPEPPKLIVSVQLDVSSAAFVEYEDELQRIMIVAANKAQQLVNAAVVCSTPLHDLNGNNVGHISINARVPN